MAEGPIAWATLIFAAMAGIGSLIRVFQVPGLILVERARRIGCVHPHFLAFSGRCEKCLKSPLSPTLPDHHNPRRPVPKGVSYP